MISSCEIAEAKGIRTTTNKRFVYKVIELKNNLSKKPIPQIFIRRTSNTTRQQERFFCRLKASLYAQSNGRLFLVLFGYSFIIDLRPI